MIGSTTSCMEKISNQFVEVLKLLSQHQNKV
uniref:Uncharacterized protein n=1 Tax=Rhizophora mucronata TaxID=61149 RepID=A0A2P2QQX2_RHIMU